MVSLQTKMLKKVPKAAVLRYISSDLGRDSVDSNEMHSRAVFPFYYILDLLLFVLRSVILHSKAYSLQIFSFLIYKDLLKINEVVLQAISFHDFIIHRMKKGCKVSRRTVPTLKGL